MFVRVEIPVSELPTRAAVAELLESGAIYAGSCSGSDSLRHDVPDAILWPWLRKQLIERPDFVADKVCIPQLARLSEMALPREAITLNTLIREYMSRRQAGAPRKNMVRCIWRRFSDCVGVETLRQLTTESWLRYSDYLMAKRYKPETFMYQVSAVRTVIRFGLRRGLDAGEIGAALDRSKVIVPPKAQRVFDPHPISPDDFHAWLKPANLMERAALLLALNACLYLADLVKVEWDDLDFSAGTFQSTRRKTGILRAAILWPVTMSAIKALPKVGTHVFVSKHGVAYAPDSLRGRFWMLRQRAGLPTTVTFSQIRDGAYTAACACPSVGMPAALMLAGHKLPGLANHYVARTPQMTAAACDAVRRHYFPDITAINLVG